MDNTPIPKYELLLDKNRFFTGSGRKAAPIHVPLFNLLSLPGKYIRRSIPEVIRDIKRVKELGFKRFILLDDNIASDQEYMLKLSQEIKKLKMQWMSQCSITVAKNEKLLKAIADSGCMVLSFGIESIKQESLNELNKGWAKTSEYPELIAKIRRAGIEVSTEMVVGTDADTLESIAATAGFIEQNKIIVPRFYILTPIPGTDLFKRLEEKNKIYNRNIYSYNGTEAVHIPANMKPEELTRAYWNLYNQVFGIKSIVNRTFLNRNFIKKPLNYLFYFFVNLVYRHDIKKGIPPNII